MILMKSDRDDLPLLMWHCVSCGGRPCFFVTCGDPGTRNMDHVGCLNPQAARLGVVPSWQKIFEGFDLL